MGARRKKRLLAESSLRTRKHCSLRGEIRWISSLYSTQHNYTVIKVTERPGGPASVST